MCPIVHMAAGNETQELKALRSDSIVAPRTSTPPGRPVVEPAQHRHRVSTL